MEQDIKDPFNWHLYDEMIDYLETHTVADLHWTVEDAIYFKADEMLAAKEDKKAFAHGKIGSVIEWIQKYGLPNNTDRRSKLFKNIAIWCVNSGISDHAIMKLDAEITSKCEGRKKGDIFGWVRWARNGRHEVNLKEIEDVAKLAKG